jgi:quercetin dioxygenase-like cupin family protein
MNFSSKACTAIALAFFAATSWAQQSHPHKYITAAGLKWADVPSLPKGAQIAVLEGTMSQAAPFTVRLRFPANYRLPPHSHPAIERVTVLTGTFHMGMGGKFERNKTQPVRAGELMIMQPGTPHFAWTDSETVVQLHGTGPWGITYLNAADDPRKH